MSFPNLPVYHDENLQIHAFGGLSEVGRNCFALHDPKSHETLLIECGMTMPPNMEDTLRPDSKYMPNLGPLIEIAKTGPLYRAATHGHDDHVGAFPVLDHLLSEAHVALIPIVSTPLTARIIERRYEQFGKSAPEPQFHLLAQEREGSSHLWRERVVLGPFECEFFAVPHSIFQTRSVRVSVNGLNVLFVSDFKWADCFAYPGLSQELEEYLRRQVPFDIVMYEALYCDRKGFAPSEDSVIGPLTRALETAPGHVIATWFASNLIRYKLAQKVVSETGFRIFPAGRTMVDLVLFGSEQGWLKAPDESGGSRILTAATGSQGEGIFADDPADMAALVKAVKGHAEHHLPLIDDDSFVFLTHPIPGNERALRALIQGLLAKCPEGLVFLTPAMFEALGLEDQDTDRLVQTPGLHASGHGFREDHAKLIEITKPRVAIPYHMPSHKVGEAIRV